MNFRYLNKSFDEALILAAYAKCCLMQSPLNSEELTVMNAFKRANPKYADFSQQQLGDLFSSLNENQLSGFVNNTKGVLHEIQFVEMENSDGDVVTAELYEAINNPGYDVVLTNNSTGEIIDLQLKASDDSAYINNWIEKHDGEIKVTSEVAERMGIESSGISNDEITANTENFIDKLIDVADSDDLWNYIPAIGAISLAIVIRGLWVKKNNGEITKERFEYLVLKCTGMKAVKLTTLTFLLLIPVVGQITAIILLTNFINQVMK